MSATPNESVPYAAIAEASLTLDDDAYKLIGWDGLVRLLEAAAPHMTPSGS